jgi:peptidoglycan/LPS O-acetylase OafA/YrhL
MGVDTFFFCSGFLLAYLGMTRATPFVPGLMMRYMRLTPSVAFMVMIYSAIVPFMSIGPFAARVQESILRKCSTGWWVPLAYIQWIYPWDGGEICAGWLWYLGNDILFFIVCLGLLSIWKINRKLCALITLAIVGASIGISLYLSYTKHLGMYIFTQHKAYEEWLYERPWHRITVFILGFSVPLLLAAPKAAIAQGQRWRITKANVSRTRAANFMVYIATFLAYVLMAVVLFLPGTDLSGRNGRQPMSWTQTQNALYITFCRPLWALGNCVIVMGCYFGYLPWTNTFLSHRFFDPLQKLTLGAYLFHPVIIKLASGSATGYYFFNYIDIYTHALAYIVMSYSVSAVSWCLVEKPFADLVDLLMPTKKKNAVREGKEQTLPTTSLNVSIRAPGVAAS